MDKVFGSALPRPCYFERFFSVVNCYAGEKKESRLGSKVKRGQNHRLTRPNNLAG